MTVGPTGRAAPQCEFEGEVCGVIRAAGAAQLSLQIIVFIAAAEVT
jgi:hypothetical protein